jgi:hypothetical protein
MFDHDFALNVNSATAHVGMWVISLERRMRELGQLGVMAKKHHALQLVAELVNDVEQVMHRAGIQPIIHHDMLELVIELLGYDFRRSERAPRRTRQDQIGFHIALR